MRFVLSGATVLLPDGGCAKRNLLIEGRTIVKVSAEPLDGIPAHTVDLTGFFMTPGLIQTHVHLFDCFDSFSDERMKRWLDAGFTFLRDEGILSYVTTEEALRWRDRLRNDVSRPSIAVCGHFLSTVGGYGGSEPVGLASPAEARDAVRRMADQGVDHFKTTLDHGFDAYSQSLPLLGEEILTALCDEAHRLGKRVSAHVNSSDKLALLVQAGIDEAAHACGDRIPNVLLQAMVDQGIAMTPTLSVYGEITNNWGAPLLANAAENVRRFVELGGVIGFGNDFICEKPIWSPVGMPMMEIELLRKAGLSMRTILRSMTLGGALVLGRDDLGRIAEGCVANLVAVRGDPTELPYLLTHMNFIMQDGIVVAQDL